VGITPDSKKKKKRVDPTKKNNLDSVKNDHGLHGYTSLSDHDASMFFSDSGSGSDSDSAGVSVGDGFEDSEFSSESPYVFQQPQLREGEI